MKERAAGFLLMCVVVPLALLGYLIIVAIGFCGPVSRARAGVRALDHFVNASVLNGYAWESVSSHAWRERDKLWARLIIRIADFIQQGHCERANKREQALVDFALARGLEQPTIK